MNHIIRAYLNFWLFNSNIAFIVHVVLLAAAVAFTLMYHQEQWDKKHPEDDNGSTPYN